MAPRDTPTPSSNSRLQKSVPLNVTPPSHGQLPIIIQPRMTDPSRTYTSSGGPIKLSNEAKRYTPGAASGILVTQSHRAQGLRNHQLPPDTDDSLLLDLQELELALQRLELRVQVLVLLSAHLCRVNLQEQEE